MKKIDEENTQNFNLKEGHFWYFEFFFENI